MGIVFSKSGFLKSTALIVGGTAGAQLLMVIASPLLTRLYTPEDFGIFAIYAAILSIFSVIASLRYELAIPLPKKDIQAVQVLIAAFLVLILISLFSGLILYFGSSYLASVLKLAEIANFLWLIPVSLFVVGLYNILSFWAIRTKNFSGIAQTKIVQVVMTILLQLMGYKYGNMALIVGHVGGQSVGVLSLGKSIFGGVTRYHISMKRIRWAFSRYRKFPIFSTWGALFNTAGVQLPPILFAALFSPAIAGVYALTHRVLTLPMSIVGNAVANVFLSDAAKAYRENRIGKMILAVHKNLSAIAMPPMIILVLTGPEVFSIVFGSQWRPAGEFAQWMVPWLYMVFITSPLSTIFEVMERQHLAVLFQVILLIFRVSSIFIGAMYEDVYLTIALFSICSTVCWGGLMIWINHACKNSLIEALRPTVVNLLISLLIAVPIIGSFFFENRSIFYMAFMLSAMLILCHYFNLYRNAAR